MTTPNQQPEVSAEAKPYDATACAFDCISECCHGNAYVDRIAGFIQRAIDSAAK